MREETRSATEALRTTETSMTTTGKRHGADRELPVDEGPCGKTKGDVGIDRAQERCLVAAARARKQPVLFSANASRGRCRVVR